MLVVKQSHDMAKKNGNDKECCKFDVTDFIEVLERII